MGRRAVSRFPLKSAFAALTTKRDIRRIQRKSVEAGERKGGGLHECDLLINGPFDSQATVRLRWLPVYATTKRASERGSLWEVRTNLSAIRPIPDCIQLHG